jgi:hypothetical protein
MIGLQLPYMRVGPAFFKSIDLKIAIVYDYVVAFCS